MFFTPVLIFYTTKLFFSYFFPTIIILFLSWKQNTVVMLLLRKRPDSKLPIFTYSLWHNVSKVLNRWTLQFSQQTSVPFCQVHPESSDYQAQSCRLTTAHSKIQSSRFFMQQKVRYHKRLAESAGITQWSKHTRITHTRHNVRRKRSSE